MSHPSTTSSDQAAALPKAGARHRQILLISVAIALYWASMYFYVPNLSVYVEDKTQNLAIVGVVGSMYGLWQAILRLPLGIITDWLGRRKPFMIAGFAFAALGAWVLATFPTPPGLIIGRSITGMAAAFWVPMVVIFSSLFPPQEAVRATSLLMMINALSRVVATGLNGRLNELGGGYELAFFVAIGFAGLAILASLPVHETPRPPKQPSLRSIFTLITRRDVLLPAGLSAIAQYIAWSSTFGFIPVLARNLGATADGNSLLMSMYLLLSMIGSMLTSFIVRRVGNKRLFFTSFILTCLGVTLAGFAGSLPQVFAIQAFLGFVSGMVFPLLMGMSIEKVVDTERATAMGLHQAVYAIGMFAGPWLSGILAESYGISPMLIATGLACLVVGLVLGMGIQTK